MLSAIPFAILPSVEAVQGATSIASAHKPRATCECHVPSRCEKKSLMTGFCVKADSVMGVINSLPAGVITTCTSAPALMSPRIIRQALYAAIEPVIPKTIFFPLSMVILLKRNGAEPRLTNYFCASRRRMRVSTCLVLYVKSPARIQL